MCPWGKEVAFTRRAGLCEAAQHQWGSSPASPFLPEVFSSDISLSGISLLSWSWENSLEQVFGANKVRQRQCSPKCFGRAPWKWNFSHLLFVKPSTATLGSPPWHNKHQQLEANRAGRNSSALRYCWALAPVPNRTTVQKRLCPPCSRIRSCKQLKLILILRSCKALPNLCASSFCHGPATITSSLPLH